MYEAIKGHSAPPDLLAATKTDTADVGVWVHYWIDHVQAAIDPANYQAFEERCCKDISKKRKARNIRNLGGLARKTIVPGILEVMRNS
jgi:hypothetical protein